MKNIDFLPARYREGYAARAAVIRRWAIVLGLSIVITPLAIYQYLVHAAVVHSFVLVEPEYMQAQAKSKRLTELQQQLDLASGEAGLLAWLNHPWPRSQVLAQIQDPLPESVRLTSIRLSVEPKPVSTSVPGERNRAARRAAEARDATAADTRPAAERDLVRLLDQAAQNNTVVTLSGVTISNTDLHTYVARLRLGGMFEKSELRSLESLPGQDSTKTQAFEIRLVLAPGYATPPKPAADKSPVAPEAAPAPVAASTRALEIARRP